MQSSSRAPELSATLRRDSCWIIERLPRLLDDADHVALAGLVALVVSMQRARAADDLLVGRMTTGEVDADGDRLVAFVGDDDALADLGGDRLALGGRGAGGSFVLGLHRGAFFAP